jgi:hypothetical protein
LCHSSALRKHRVSSSLANCNHKKILTIRNNKCGHFIPHSQATYVKHNNGTNNITLCYSRHRLAATRYEINRRRESCQPLRENLLVTQFMRNDTFLMRKLGSFAAPPVSAFYKDGNCD